MNRSYHTDDALALGTLGELTCVEDVACFAYRILTPDILIFLVIPSKHCGKLSIK